MNGARIVYSVRQGTRSRVPAVYLARLFRESRPGSLSSIFYCSFVPVVSSTVGSWLLC